VRIFVPLDSAAKALGAERDGARRDDDDLLAGGAARGDIIDNGFQPVPPHAAIGGDEQRGADLDDQPGAVRGAEAV
jgi:hypothetical protein